MQKRKKKDALQEGRELQDTTVGSGSWNSESSGLIGFQERKPRQKKKLPGVLLT